ncbi:manganese-dependent inorganic pyrophosphatase [Thermodesulfobium acidiphilum]|uniref:inorganic diphosphatase n=1 Tax=Thermodesulfobium acidiphilum TaxID=1794699 RepID=A0A2R4VZ52_THEAF|nr:manganese-dependent inorganic pyrophosphatase [Thermodesulfobium acidiphilum]AWB09831.1 manganese-dependent inorganic pyrophosphatase [Thermodesulfobium acidiphilum]
MSDVYVVGHKAPDTDSVCSAIVYAELKGYNSARAGELNDETKFVLNKFGFKEPELLENVEGKKLVLVDHNEASQRVCGEDSSMVIEIIDHHKFNFVNNTPIYILNEPLGSTCTILAKHYMDKIKDKPKLAGLLLSALLSDTVIFKSPTTTEEDKKIAQELAKIAGIDDINAFGIEIKKVQGSIIGKPIDSVVKKDYKDFDFGGKKVGIGQTEILDINEAYDRKNEIIKFIEELKNSGGYAMVAFAATDIMKEGSELFFAGDPGIIEKAFGKKPEGNSLWLPGVMSRKKQIAPPLEKAFKS